MSANTSAAVAVLPSSRQTGGSGSGTDAARQRRRAAGPRTALVRGLPAGRRGIGWVGMSSRMCLKAHLLYGGSCQLARVTCASGAGGKPVMSPVRALARRGLGRAVVGHDAQTNRTRARLAVI